MRQSIRAEFDRLVTGGFRAELVEGALDSEIDEWARRQGVRTVPEAFREVLRLVGRQPGAFIAGTTFGIRGPDAFTKELAQAALNEADIHEIANPADLLVISEAGGYSFLVIDGADLNLPDPPVREVLESGSLPNKFDSVTELFGHLVDGLLDFRDRVARNLAENGSSRLMDRRFTW